MPGKVLAMDGAAPTPVRIHVSIWQLVAAVATCAVLFFSGFAIGRLTATTDSSIGSLSASAPGGPSTGNDVAGSTADGTGTETAATAATDPDSKGEGADADDSGGLTVEALEEALAAVDHDRIRFEPGTEQLTTDGLAAVSDIAEILVTNPFIPVEVEIRTFTEATPGENHGLSVLQAYAVTEALIAAGVDPARLTAVGLGGSDELPDVDQLVRFGSNDSETDRLLTSIDVRRIVFDPSGAVAGGDDTIEQIVDAMATNPSATLDLVGYAYVGDADTSHDRSHVITDAVAARLTAAGLNRDRIEIIGLGDTPTQFDAETTVEFEVGPPAALTLALRQIDESRIQFEGNTATLTADGASTLIEVANALQLDPEQRVEISTHSYGEATSSGNHQLSHRQGDAIIEALVAAGIDADRLVLKAHGDPIAFRQGNRAGYVSFYPLD